MAKNVITLQHIEIESIPIETVFPNAYNPNRQSDRDFELLCRSIEEDGFTQPIIVQRDTNTIVDGEHRWRACKALGKTHIDVVFVTMTEAQRLISTLRHNRARGSENLSLVADVLKDLKAEGVIDAAADSLMMDDVELEIMLEDIPAAEISLRQPGERLNAQEVEKKNEEERMIAIEQIRKDRKKADAETSSRITITFKLTGEDRNVILTALENIAPKAEPQDQIFALICAYPDQHYD